MAGNRENKLCNLLEYAAGDELVLATYEYNRSPRYDHVTVARVTDHVTVARVTTKQVHLSNGIKFWRETAKMVGSRLSDHLSPDYAVYPSNEETMGWVRESERQQVLRKKRGSVRHAVNEMLQALTVEQCDAILAVLGK